MSALGSLVVKLALEHAEFNKGLDRSSQEAQRFAKNSQSAIQSFENSAKSSLINVGKSAAGAAAAFLAVDNVIGKLASSIKFADEINDVAKANEVAVGSILKLSEALALNGGQASDTTKLFSALTSSLDEAAGGSEKAQKSFSQVGVTLNDLRTLDGQALFDKTLAGLAMIEDPIKRNALAMDLLGKAAKGVDIAGLANDYSNNQESFNQAEKSFKEIGDAMDKLDKLSFRASQSLAENFGPVINDLVTGLDNLLFGFDNLEKKLQKNQNKGSGDFKFGPTINDKPGTGGFNFPAEYRADKGLRDVTDPVAEAAKRAQAQADKAAQERKRKAIEDAQDIARQESAFREKVNNDYQTQLKKAFDKRKEDEKEAELAAAKEVYEAKMKYLDMLQDEASRNFEEAQRAAKEAQEEAVRNQQQIARELSQAFTNGLFDSFRNGEKFGKAMVRNIVALGQTLFARMLEGLLTGGGSVISALFAGGSSLASGSAAAGEVLTGKGSNSIFGQLSSIKEIFSSGNNFFTSSIEKLGVMIADGNGGIADAIGGFLGQNASGIASGLSYAGAIFQALKGNIAGAALTAIGTAIGGPIGGLIGGAIGSLFGGKKYKRFGTSVSGFQAAGGTYSQTGQGVIYDRPLAGTADPLNNLNKSFSETLAALFGAFGASSSVGTYSALYQRGKSKKSGGIFNAVIDGLSLGRMDVVLKKASLDQVYNALVEKVLGEGLVKAIQASKLTDGVKKFFNGLTKKEEVLETINVLSSLNAQLKDLPPVFNAVRDAINTTAYSTSVKELQAQMQATQTFVQLFYSADEQFNIATKQLTTQLDSLNQSLPTSREEYRKLVDSIVVVDDATRNQFNGLVSLAPAMDQYFKYLEQQKEGVEQVNDALANALEKNLFSTYADYITAQSMASNGLNYTGMVGNLATQNAQGGGTLLNEIQLLKDEQANTRTVLEAIAKYTMETMKIQSLWNGDGLPAVRTV